MRKFRKTEFCTNCAQIAHSVFFDKIESNREKSPFFHVNLGKNFAFFVQIRCTRRLGSSQFLCWKSHVSAQMIPVKSVFFRIFQNPVFCYFFSRKEGRRGLFGLLKLKIRAGVFSYIVAPAPYPKYRWNFRGKKLVILKSEFVKIRKSRAHRPEGVFGKHHISPTKFY